MKLKNVLNLCAVILTILICGCSYKKPRSNLEVMKQVQPIDDNKLSEAMQNLGLEKEEKKLSA